MENVCGMPVGWTVEEEGKERGMFRSKRIFYIERDVFIEVSCEK